jgi:VanZ family protein
MTMRAAIFQARALAKQIGRGKTEVMQQLLSSVQKQLAAKRVRRLAGLASGLIALVILFLCLLPGSDLPDVPLTDKTEHFIAYLGLSAPLAVAMGRGRIGLALMLAVAYGGFVEIAQGLAPTGRSASWLDALANAIGAALGSGAVALILRRH